MATAFFLHLCVGAALSITAPLAIAQSPKKHEHALTILIPGISDHTSKQWLATGAAIAPTKEVFAIEINGAQGDLKRERNLNIPRENIIPITFNNKDSVNTAITQEEVRKAIEKIAARKNVTVILDMPIGIKLGQKTWVPQTNFAGALAAKLAETHRQQHKDSYKVIMGHSAGTEAVHVAQGIQSRRQEPFDLSIAASPRCKDCFTPGTIMLVADGDFWYSPRGNIPGPAGIPTSVFSTMSEKDAIDLAGKGYIVARIPDPASAGTMAAQAAAGLAFPIVGTVRRFQSERTHHSALTEMSSPLKTVVLYPGHGSEHVKIKTTSLGSVVNQISAMHSGILTGNAEQRLAEARKLGQERAWIEPTEDLGGISLNAIADAPFDAENVIRATFERGSHRIVLAMRNARPIAIALPRLSLEALIDIYRIAYVDGEKPEVSIGSLPSSRDLRVDDQAKRRSGNGVPVYYLGGTESTELGRALYRADEALGNLAFGSTATIQEVANRVVGFHSLPELFVEKYADHPADHLYLGSSTVYANLERVQIAAVQSLPARIWPFSSSVDYELKPPTFAVRFGRGAGPAEAAFAAFFTLHYNEIARTELGRPLADLVPFAQAVALFRWLRANDISMQAELLEGRVGSVHTPLETPSRKVVRLTDVSPSAPGIKFNDFGPSEIWDAAGRKTVLRYVNGQPIEILRHDGAALRIARDSIGIPVVITDGTHSQTFYSSPELGLTLATNVDVQQQGINIATALTARSVIYPLSQRDPPVAIAIARFATKVDDSWTRVED